MAGGEHVVHPLCRVSQHENPPMGLLHRLAAMTQTSGWLSPGLLFALGQRHQIVAAAESHLPYQQHLGAALRSKALYRLSKTNAR